MARFAVRARAVDMLGRQQIAGIPTAIHELFKNAHDAYATRVEADYIRADRTLVIRDNGLGMTKADFENKWLALGTESKFGDNRRAASEWTGPENLPVRPVLGEKGIGRLAIATIAPITLVLTRAVRRDEGLHDIVAALVCWRLFEIPGLDIADIDIPIETFDHVPTREEIEGLRDRICDNVHDILPKGPQRQEVLYQLAAFNIVPSEMDDWFAADPERTEPNLSLRGDGYGTHFFVAPTDPVLDADLAQPKEPAEAEPIKRMLLGFSNSMAPDQAPPIKAEFRDHRPSGAYDEVIGLDEFFSADDFEHADHLIEGSFDEYGQFRGTIGIYREQPEDYVLSWPGAAGAQTECGPFSVRIALIQGNPYESRLPPDHHKLFLDKTYRFGGLYVYRDGIRVLPYGQSDFDWLNIERRRTLKASDWYFSHRRMIGYVAIDHEHNPLLQEKAGREGFRHNKAFRQLRDILENWLQQIAKDYFRKEAERGEAFREIRDDLKRQADLLARRKAAVQGRKKAFRQELMDVLDKVDHGAPEASVEKVLTETDTELRGLGSASAEAVRLESTRIEKRAMDELSALAKAFFIPEPRNFSPSKDDQASYQQYAEWYDSFISSRLDPARSAVSEKVSAARAAAGVDVRVKERALAALTAEKSEALKAIRLHRRGAEEQLKLAEAAVKESLKRHFDGFQNHIESVMSELQRADLDGLPADEAFAAQRDMERRITEHLQQNSKSLAGIESQLAALRQDLLEETVPEETTAALENRIADLEEQLALYNDLAQAGSAVGIIGHEMDNLVDGIRRAIRDLKPWADGTEELADVYDRLRAHFDHLDGFLALFAPLSRRVRRRKTRISGTMLLRYIVDAFEDRLERAEIDLQVTEAFREAEVETFTSTLYAAFVNILDNAVYWITSDRHSERWIRLDADSRGYLISNGGPGIPLRVAGRIFDYGISNKPQGRGLGLTVSRDALESVGMKLSLLTTGLETPPVFLIGTSAEDDENA